jgi:hypothetical protein
MSDSDFQDPFDEIKARLNRIVEAEPMSPALAFETKQMPPAKFLETRFRKELAVLLHISQTRIVEIAGLCLSSAENILNNPARDWKFPAIYALCVYYHLLTSCCNVHPSVPDQEAIDENAKRAIIRQSSLVLTTEFGPYTAYLRNYFSLLLSAIGSHSTVIYADLFQKVRADLAAGAKNLSPILKPWIYLPGSIGNLTPALWPIYSDLPIFTKDKDLRRALCDMLQMMISMSFKRNFAAYSKWLDGDQDVKNAKSVFEQIDQWKDKDSKQVWPTQMALFILCMPGQRDQIEIDFLGRLRAFADAKTNAAVNALLFGWHAFALSFNNAKLADLFREFYEPFLNWYSTQRLVGAGSEKFMKYAYVDFPVCCLYYDEMVFSTKVLPMLMLEKTDLLQYVVRIIRRLCKLSHASGRSYDTIKMFSPLMAPCFTLLKRALSDKDPKVLLSPLIRSFCIYPGFLRILLDRQAGFLELFTETVRKHKSGVM